MEFEKHIKASLEEKAIHRRGFFESLLRVSSVVKQKQHEKHFISFCLKGKKMFVSKRKNLFFVLRQNVVQVYVQQEEGRETDRHRDTPREVKYNNGYYLLFQSEKTYLRVGLI